MAILQIILVKDFGNLHAILVYKERRENQNSPFLSNFRCCHCNIYDVIASLLLNKASKIELVVPYKGVPYKSIICV